jgi:hypothetical protein
VKASLVAGSKAPSVTVFGARANGIGSTYCSIRTVVTGICARKEDPASTGDNDHDGADTQTSSMLHPDPGYSVVFNVQLYY